LSDRPESEDCLVLNIWTRGLRDGGKRPMMFWIHGGDPHQLSHTTNGFAPVVDGSVLPQHPFHPRASALMADVPLIIGMNRTEMTLQLAGDSAAIAFARTGNPNTSKLPPWTPYTSGQRATLVLNDSSAIVSDPFGARREAMQAAMKL
jgi:carboxylesterase type B